MSDERKHGAILTIIIVFSIVNFVSMIVLSETFIFMGKRLNAIERDIEKFKVNLFNGMEDVPR